MAAANRRYQGEGTFRTERTRRERGSAEVNAIARRHAKPPRKAIAAEDNRAAGGYVNPYT